MNSQDHESIAREIAIAAPIDRVYAALMDPAEVVRWWGDESHRVTAMQSDLRVGGAWRSDGVATGGTAFAVHGIYRVVDPPHALEFTWIGGASHDLTETVVRYELHERDGVTHVRVEHTGFARHEDGESYASGWPRVLAWLDAYVARSLR